MVKSPRPLNPVFFPDIGGPGLDPGENLLRFIGAFEEAESLIQGRLSLTRVKAFRDSLEGQRTDGDYDWMRMFFASQHHFALSKLEKRRLRMREEAFVSCWHRVSDSSDLQRLELEYLGDGTFRCVALSSVQAVLNSGFQPGGPFCSLEFFPVIYVDDEKKRLECYIEEHCPICGYPELMFKRAAYAFEQEARFVLHDFSATMHTPCPTASPFVQDTNWEQVAINPSIFLTGLVALNDYTYDRLKQLGTSLPILRIDSAHLREKFF